MAEVTVQSNYLELVKKFKKENGSRFAKESSEECLLMFLEFILREQNIITSKRDHIELDGSCFCGKYKLGDLMTNCDGGCMYPGA